MGEDFFSVLLRRRSIRVFRPEPVPPELLEEVLEAARWAPSAGNLQAWEVAVVFDPELRYRLARAALDQDFIAQAPCVLVVSALPTRSALRYGRRGRELYCLQDAALAAGYLMLAACALGLGTCWVGAFDEDGVREITGLPRDHRPVAVIPLGFPAEDPPPPPRLPLEELVRWV